MSNRAQALSCRGKVDDIPVEKFQRSFGKDNILSLNLRKTMYRDPARQTMPVIFGFQRQDFTAIGAGLVDDVFYLAKVLGGNLCP